MWIMLSDSFLSIVAHHREPAVLTVRARQAGDIKRVFPKVRVHATPQRDYGFRAIVSREAVAAAMAAQVQAIDYSNFKDSVPESARHDAYLSVWCVMQDWARGRYARREPLGSPPPWGGDWTLPGEVEER